MSNQVSRDQPLYSLEAEWALIGSGLQDATVFTEAEVQQAMFHQLDCGEIWAAALELVQQGVAPDLISLPDALIRRGSRELPGDIQAKLTKMIASVPTAVHFASYAATIKDYYNRREANRVSVELARAVTRKDDFDKSLTRARDRLTSLTLQKKVDFGSVLWAPTLLAKDLPPPSWIVPDLLPTDCLAMLGGKVKLGKSWLTLQLAVAVASGGKFLGRDCKQGKVIYLALEDNERNLQDRLRQQGAEEGLMPANLGFLLRFSYLNEAEGMEKFIALLRKERPLLAIVDTLSSAKNSKVREDEAGDTADLLNPMRNLAQDNGCTVFFNHHHTKGAYDDPALDLRGSSAIGAACDVIWGLYRVRGQKRAKLSSVGRNVIDLELAMDFDKTTACWQVVGEAEAVERKENVQAILKALQHMEADTENLAVFTELTRRAVTYALDDMLEADPPIVAYREVETTARGLKKRIWYLPST